MIKLSTPFGTAYLFEASDKLGDRLFAVGAPYIGTNKYKTPTRPVYPLTGGSKSTLYVSNTEENMKALVGDAYVPDTPFKKKAKKAKSTEEGE